VAVRITHVDNSSTCYLQICGELYLGPVFILEAISWLFIELIYVQHNHLTLGGGDLVCGLYK